MSTTNSRTYSSSDPFHKRHFSTIAWFFIMIVLFFVFLGLSVGMLFFALSKITIPGV